MRFKRWGRSCRTSTRHERFYTWTSELNYSPTHVTESSLIGAEQYVELSGSARSFYFVCFELGGFDFPPTGLKTKGDFRFELVPPGPCLGRKHRAHPHMMLFHIERPQNTKKKASTPPINSQSQALGLSTKFRACRPRQFRPFLIDLANGLADSHLSSGRRRGAHHTCGGPRFQSTACLCK